MYSTTTTMKQKRCKCQLVQVIHCQIYSLKTICINTYTLCKHMYKCINNNKNKNNKNKSQVEIEYAGFLSCVFLFFVTGSDIFIYLFIFSSTFNES